MYEIKYDSASLVLEASVEQKKANKAMDYFLFWRRPLHLPWQMVVLMKEDQLKDCEQEMEETELFIM